MDSTVVGGISAVVGFVVGNAFTYFSARRDAWLEARASGLVVLATVADLRAASTDQATIVGVPGVIGVWETEKRAIAKFRPGTYPNGLRTAQWLALDGQMSTLSRLDATNHLETVSDDEVWRDTYRAAHDLLAEIDSTLQTFKVTGPVALYVIRHGLTAWLH